MRGILTRVEQKKETWAGREKTVIYLFVRGTDLKRYTFIDPKFEPYCYFRRGILDPTTFPKDVRKHKVVKIKGKTYLKVWTFFPNQVAKLRRIIEQKYRFGVNVYEADVLFPLRYIIDKKIRAAVEWDQFGRLFPIDEDLPSNLRIFIIDIELMDGTIKCLTIWDSYDDCYHTFYWNKTAIPINTEPNWKLNYFSTEEDMLRDVFRFIRKRNPDVVTGFNIDFDLVNIRDRALELAVGEWDWVNPMHTKKSPYHMPPPRSRKKKFRDFWLTGRSQRIPGRNVIDLLEILLKMEKHQLSEFNLNYIARNYLKPPMEKLTWKGLAIGSNISKIWPQDPEAVLRYNKHDVEMEMELNKQQHLIAFADEIRKFAGCQLDDILSNKRIAHVELLRKTKKPLPVTKKEKRPYKGAIVIEPRKGVYKWIIVMDFRSLYPSVILQLNIDPDTYIPKSKRKSYNITTAYILKDPETNTEFWFKKKPEGDLPAILHTYLEKRNNKKKQREIARRQRKFSLAEIYDIQQWALKVIANAFYGCFDPETFVLSPEGIKNIKNFKKGDEVWTLNPKTKKVEISKVKEVFQYPYSGDLIRFKNQKLDLLLTPNHRMFLRKNNNKEYQIYQAEEASKFYYAHFPELKPLKMKKNSRLDRNLLGIYAWYLTEGSLYRNKRKEYLNGNIRGISNKIQIAQTDKTNRERIISFIKGIGQRPVIEKKAISFNSAEWWDKLARDCGKGSYKKHIPQFIKKTSLEDLNFFLKELMRGDGRKNQNDYRTVSEELAKDVCFIAARLGKATSLVGRDKWNCFTVHFSSKRGKKTMIFRNSHVERVPYKGKVYCISTEKNHIILAGRNMKFQWVGQSLLYRGMPSAYQCARAVTLCARQAIIFAKEVIEKMGYNVIYGDTDSIMVESKFDNYQKVVQEAEYISKKVAKEMPKFLTKLGAHGKKSYLDLALDKVFKDFLIDEKKKRYAGIPITQRGEGRLEVKGFGAVRSDTSQFTRDLQKVLIKEILRGRRKEDIKYITENLLDEYDNLPLSQIGVPCVLTKDPSKYKTNSIQKKAFHFCLKGNTLIKTPRGEIPIINLKPGDKVFSFLDGKIVEAKVLNKWQKNGIREIAVIKLKDRILEVSLDQGLRTQRGWKRVKFINPKKDFLLGEKIFDNSQRENQTNYLHKRKLQKKDDYRNGKSLRDFSFFGLVLDAKNGIKKKICRFWSTQLFFRIEKRRNNLFGRDNRWRRNHQNFQNDSKRRQTQFISRALFRKYFKRIDPLDFQWLKMSILSSSKIRAKAKRYLFNLFKRVPTISDPQNDQTLFKNQAQTMRNCYSVFRTQTSGFFQKSLFKRRTKALEGKLRFEQIISLELKPNSETLYDIETSQHNYFANGILVHNSNTYLGTKYRVGDKPKRIYVKMVEKKVPIDVVEKVDVVAFLVDLQLPNWLKIDYPKMIEKTVKPKIEKVLKFLDLEWKDIRLKSTLKKKKKKRKRKKKTTGKKNV